MGVNGLLHGLESDVYADAGYLGTEKRPDARKSTVRHVAVKPSNRKALDKTTSIGLMTAQLETVKASIRAKVEHPPRVIQRKFGHVKVRYFGLPKNTA